MKKLAALALLLLAGPASAYDVCVFHDGANDWWMTPVVTPANCQSVGESPEYQGYGIDGWAVVDHTQVDMGGQSGDCYNSATGSPVGLPQISWDQCQSNGPGHTFGSQPFGGSWSGGGSALWLESGGGNTFGVNLLDVAGNLADVGSLVLGLVVFFLGYQYTERAVAPTPKGRKAGA